jgi:lipoate-protein ligase A
MKSWRVIIEGENTASYNMAADAFLLEQAENGNKPPAIRLYGWDKPSITIGYHQKFERAVDPSHLGATPVVRRITGGRALLHDEHELTYALAGNFSRYPELGLTLHDSHHLISQAIVSFYNFLGWSAGMSLRDDPVLLSKPGILQKGCFASVSQYDIVVGDRKIAAGSQRRTENAFMQHGAVKLKIPVPHSAIEEPPQDIDNECLIPVRLARGKAQESLINIFVSIYKIGFANQPFSTSEKGNIEGLLASFENLNCA